MIANQEQLFVVSEQNESIAPVAFESNQLDGASVNLQERNIRLQNVLLLLAHKNSLEGLIRTNSELLTDSSNFARNNSEAKIAKITGRINHEFAHLTGHYALLDQGEDSREVQQSTRGMFSDFLKKYYGTRNRQQNLSYRKSLEDAQTLVLDEHSNSAVQQDVTSDIDTDTAQDLDNFSKLHAIFNDDRAGFIPATNNEKTKILTWLDYIDSEGGIGAQLLEIFRNQQKLAINSHKTHAEATEDGLRAVESIIYETIDFFCNAYSSQQSLINIKNLLSGDINPKLKVGVVLVDDPEVNQEEVRKGLGFLARFIAVKKLYDKQISYVLSRDDDPMLSVKLRSSSSGPGKRKEITDRYSVEKKEEKIEQEIDVIVNDLTVNQVRTFLSEAIINETTRTKFYRSRIAEIADFDHSSRLLRPLAQIARNALDEFKIDG